MTCVMSRLPDPALSDNRRVTMLRTLGLVR